MQSRTSWFRDPPDHQQPPKYSLVSCMTFRHYSDDIISPCPSVGVGATLNLFFPLVAGRFSASQSRNIHPSRGLPKTCLLIQGRNDHFFIPDQTISSYLTWKVGTATDQYCTSESRSTWIVFVDQPRGERFHRSTFANHTKTSPGTYNTSVHRSYRDSRCSYE